eukprot:TRINITY_DN22195_c0_g1_i2.p1 TRINITY_DN22195_c0_g1~~TRINITY_DN22195_c0_g1_i2.p1  ORF type:complete len:627 (+),score=242.60 TRINITY_DN22195_c0_g1_i2:47-1882(+)
MGRKTIARARPSAMYPKWSAEYWDLRDRQEKQWIDGELDGSDEDTPTTPTMPKRKSRRKSEQQWAGEESRIASSRLEELAEKDRYIDEQREANKSIEHKYKRLQEEFEEEKRKHCLTMANKDRELKELDALVSTNEEMYNEEKRRRLCLEDEIRKLNEKRTEDHNEQQLTLKKLSDLEMRIEESKVKVTNTETEMSQKDATITRLKESISKLEIQLELSEAKRLETSRINREVSTRIEELQSVQDTITSLQGRTEELEEAKKCINILKTEHQNEIMKLTETFNAQLVKEKETCDSLKVHAHQLEEKLKTEKPKEDNTLRGQVDELRRENSRVREEKRNTQSHLNKANTDLRRMTRKNEQLQKLVTETQQQAALVPDLQKRVEDLTIQVNSLSVVYETSAPGDQRLSTAKQEIERSKHQEQVLLKLAEERLTMLEGLKKDLAEAEVRMDSMSADCDKLRSENSELQATVASLRSERDDILAAEAKTLETISLKQDEEKSKDREESTQLKKSVQEVTKRLREEVKETEALIPNVFGWKIQKGKGNVAWKIAPVNAQGRASWKTELAVAQADGKYLAMSSPLLDHYLKKRDRDTDEVYEAYEVITACAPDFVKK